MIKTVRTPTENQLNKMITLMKSLIMITTVETTNTQTKIAMVVKRKRTKTKVKCLCMLFGLMLY